MEKKVIFHRSLGRVAIAETVYNKLCDFRQKSISDLEAGGILLGRHIIGTLDVVVDDISLPCREDRRGRFFFRRSKPSAQDKVNSAWQISGGTRIYLGEWHTHPEIDPTPSMIDMDNWIRILRSTVFEQDSLFFVIVGTAGTSMWETIRPSFQVRKLIRDP